MTAALHTLTVLAVTDLARSKQFYRAWFDWPFTVETSVYVEMQDARGMRLGLYQRDGFAVQTGVRPVPVAHGELTGAELYLTCEDWETMHTRAETAVARLLSPPAARPWGDEASYWCDPDGVVIALSRPLPVGGG
ncbi:MAG: VOC family protein [Planctomycetota bacterium]